MPCGVLPRGVPCGVPCGVLPRGPGPDGWAGTEGGGRAGQATSPFSFLCTGHGSHGPLGVLNAVGSDMKKGQLSSKT